MTDSILTGKWFVNVSMELNWSHFGGLLVDFYVTWIKQLPNILVLSWMLLSVQCVPIYMYCY